MGGMPKQTHCSECGAGLLEHEFYRCDPASAVACAKRARDRSKSSARGVEVGRQESREDNAAVATEKSPTSPAE